MSSTKGTDTGVERNASLLDTLGRLRSLVPLSILGLILYCSYHLSRIQSVIGGPTVKLTDHEFNDLVVSSRGKLGRVPIEGLSERAGDDEEEGKRTVGAGLDANQQDMLEQKICIDIQKFNISEGRDTPHSFPSPSCRTWYQEGQGSSEEAEQGDVFFPPNRESAVKQFEYLHKIITTHMPSDICREAMAKDVLRSYRRSDDKIDVVFPAMWGDELEMIFKTMANHKPKSYFEWGAGGSTRWIAAWASEKAISVDNFKPWCDKVLRDPVVKCMTEEGIFSQGCITPKDAQTGWGKMQHSDDNEKVSKAFINSIDTYNHSRYDTILVDGRFRQACALKALHYMDENSILLFHDFWSRWEKYDFVLEYFNPIGRSRTIGVLRRKPDEELPSDWKEAYLRYSTLQFQN